MESAGLTIKKNWRQLFYDLARSEKKFERGEHARDRPKLLRNHLREVHRLEQDIAKASTLEERLDVSERKIAQGMLSNFEQSKSVYKEAQRELVAQIAKEDKAQKRRTARATRAARNEMAR